MMGYKAAIGVCAVALLSSGTHAQMSSIIYNPATDHYYAQFTVDDGILWDDARIAAELLTYGGVSGHLATATTAEENQFIIDSFYEAGADMYWLGGFQAFDSGPEADPSAGWQWVTGEDWTFTNWISATNEPNDSGPLGEDVLRMWRQDWFLDVPSGDYAFGMWNDEPVNIPAPGFVVEFLPANVPAPGTVSMLTLAGLALTGRRRR